MNIVRPCMDGWLSIRPSSFRSAMKRCTTHHRSYLRVYATGLLTCIAAPHYFYLFLDGIVNTFKTGRPSKEQCNSCFFKRWRHIASWYARSVTEARQNFAQSFMTPQADLKEIHGMMVEWSMLQKADRSKGTPGTFCCPPPETAFRGP